MYGKMQANRDQLYDNILTEIVEGVHSVESRLAAMRKISRPNVPNTSDR